MYCSTPDCDRFTEGTTKHCGTCNRAIRKKKEDEEKEKHKRSKAIRLSEERNRKYAERAKDRTPRASSLNNGKEDSKGLRKPKPIKPRSTRRAAEEREYLRRREKYLTLHPDCERCGSPAGQIHHRAGRTGKMLINVLYFMAVCPDCHHWIELHPEESKEEGYSINRLTV